MQRCAVDKMANGVPEGPGGVLPYIRYTERDTT
ncbi:hypothetical protein QZH41_014988 [Actinostola sp. cb2023]|nr:hypothetical protein QZH41_014988 [Actinostola sp. cb2023]